MSGFWTCHECGAEMYGFENCQFCGAHKGGGEANWERLFGTPERAARTLAKACGECDDDLPCCECPLYPIVGRNVYEPEILEWLREDAE